MIVVLGAGLAGLSTALHLGGREFAVIERESEVGGLARSACQDGFCFDFAGHVLHLRDASVRALVDDLLGEDQLHVQRSAWIRLGDRLVPYPFQVNTHALPLADRVACVAGFAHTLLPRPPARGARLSCQDWILDSFGAGFAERFFLPYNEKCLATDLTTLSADWPERAIPKPDLEEVVRGALGIAARAPFGANATFRYPRSGGMHRLPEAMARRLPPVRRGARALRIDARRRVLELADGSALAYDALVATNPLPELIAMISDLGPEERAAAARLRHSSLSCFCFGLRGALPHGRHWVYCPEKRYPFHRVSYPANIAPSMAPAGMSSACAEVSYARDCFPPPAGAEEGVLAGLIAAGEIEDAGRVVLCRRLDLPFAYVLHDGARREVLPLLFRALRERSIIPVGRYATWSYLSMEDVILQGKEAAAHLCRGS
ncbi:MAG: FAD-dependent oxidoreductase [Planctomycetes bacterium]|nr:FAD-dependent oxidoreductase [Planctomycetota bacterium]